MANDGNDVIMLSGNGGSGSKRCQPFCDCQFPSCGDLNTTRPSEIIKRLKCRCGEEAAVPGSQHLDWRWQPPLLPMQQPCVEIEGPDIIFHPSFSQGTAIVRGERPLKAGMIHFWEMRIITEPCGTDVMFGIGTDKVDLEEFRFHFVSALGTNAQSWGLSYRGRLQHKGVHRTYGRKISQGCILGVYLDRVCGQLEFFVNRRSLGVAYADIVRDPSVEIYPMVSSTAARSIVRLMNSTSLSDSLQFRAFRQLVRQREALAELEQMPGLRPLLVRFWFLTPPVRYSRHSTANEFDIADEAVLSSAALRQSSVRRRLQDDDFAVDDLYADADVAVRRVDGGERSDSSDEPDLYEHFDEHFHYML